MRGATPFVAALSLAAFATDARAQSVEETNGCTGTSMDPCVRTGSCMVQSATWSQTVTITRSDLYDTMGWPGVCDQVHVALVQGACSPGGAQVDVTAELASNSSAFVPLITGLLSCGAPPPPAVPLAGTLGLTGLGTADGRAARGYHRSAGLGRLTAAAAG